MEKQQRYQKVILKQLMEKVTAHEMDVLTNAIKRIMLEDSDRPWRKMDTEYMQSRLLQMADVKD